MDRVNKLNILYKDIKELPDEVIYELKHRKAYDEKYDKDFLLMPILSIEYLPKKKGIGNVPESSQPLIFLGEEEIKNGEEKLKEIELREDATEIDAVYYRPNEKRTQKLK